MAVLLTCALPAAGQAAFVRRTLLPPAPELGGDFGRSLLSADLDGDGFEDLIVAEARDTVDGVDNAGRLWIFHGPDFSKFRDVTAEEPLPKEEMGWRRGTVADVDEDGNLDLLVASSMLDVDGVTNVGRAHLFLGPDFETDLVYDAPKLQDQQFGYGNAVFRFPDGQQKLVIGSPALSLPGSLIDGAVSIFEPFSGAPPVEVPAPTGFGAFGSDIAVHDLTGDGVDDLLVSEPGAFPPGAPGFGLIHVFDGATGRWLDPLPPPATSPVVKGFGNEVHHFGDLDGDSIADLFLSSIATEVDGLQSAGVGLVMAGPDFTELVHEFKPPQPVSSGQYGQRAAVGDLDLDGHPDVVIGDPAQSEADDRAYLHFGPDFDVVQVFGEDEMTWGFGRTVHTLDWDGDGCDELAVTGAFANGSGILYLYDPQTLFADRPGVSVSLGGTVNFGLDFPDTHAGKEYRAVLGLSGSLPGTILGPGSWLPLNLDALSIASVALANGPTLPGFTGTLDESGNAAFALVLRPGVAAAPAGQTLDVAAVLLDDGPQPYGAGSSALQIDLTP